MLARMVGGVIAASVLGGCVAETGSEEEVGAAAEAATEPTYVVGGWYWGYIVQPIGDRRIECPDGTVHTLCFVDGVDLGSTGLTSTQQDQVRTGMNEGGWSEATAGVLAHGSFLSRRDHRSGTTRHYFVPTDVYTSPTQRTHAAAFALLGTRPDGTGTIVQVAYGVEVPWPARVDVTWDLPAGESPPPGTLYSDIYVTGRLAEPLTYPQTHPIELIADQYFRRVRPPAVVYPVTEFRQAW